MGPAQVRRMGLVMAWVARGVTDQIQVARELVEDFSPSRNWQSAKAVASATINNLVYRNVLARDAAGTLSVKAGWEVLPEFAGYRPAYPPYDNAEHHHPPRPEAGSVESSAHKPFPVTHAPLVLPKTLSDVKAGVIPKWSLLHVRLWLATMVDLTPKEIAQAITQEDVRSALLAVKEATRAGPD